MNNRKMLLIQVNRSLKRNSGFASFISKASKKGKRVSGVLSKTEPPEKKVFRHLVKLFDNNGFLLFLLLLTNGGFLGFGVSFDSSLLCSWVQSRAQLFKDMRLK